MSYTRACRTCGAELGTKIYEVKGALAYRGCAMKHDPSRVAAFDVANAAQEAAAGAARPGEVVAALAAMLGDPSGGWAAGAGPSGSQVEALAKMFDGDPKVISTGPAKDGDVVSALAAMMN